jgi:hypothetical protein
MPTISEIRQQYPQYEDMSDEQLADALHSKFYSDMPREQFNQRVGLTNAAQAERDAYYSSGIYAGEYNPLGPIAKTIDAFASGAQRAPLMGWDDEVAAGLTTAGGMAGDYEQTRDAMRDRKAAQREQNPVASTLGEVSGLMAASGVPSFAGRAIEAGRSLPAVAFGSAVDGSILGAIQGAGDAEGGVADTLENAGYGALGGLVIGGGLPIAARAIGSTARRVISPFQANPERTAAADYLTGEGVRLSAGQRTGSDALRYAESELGGSATQSLMERQGEQFTAAALRRAGIDAPRATPEVMDSAFTRIGNGFDDLAARNELMPDQQLARDLGATAREYLSLVPESARAPVVMNTIQDLGAALGRGPMNGEAYQAARSRIDRAARRAVQDPNLQDALYGIRNALDDAMERTIVTRNPVDLGAWREVRRQYRNMLVLERAATTAGEDAAQGIISPAALRNATVAKQGRRNYARGDGDFAELARAGSATMKSMPNSGTAGRLSAQNMGTGLSSLLGMGAAGYGSGGDPMTMIAGAAAGYAVPRLAGRALMTPIIQAILANQRGTGMQMSPQTRAVFEALTNRLAAEESPDVGRSIASGGF